MKDKHVKMYAEMAEVAAKQSYATRLKVGAIAVRDHRILSVGYNGSAPGADNVCEDETGKTKPDVIHAEMNVILKMARDGESGKDADLFITHSPCFQCANAILGVGFKRVWFSDYYRDDAGISHLEKHGVPVTKI